LRVEIGRSNDPALLGVLAQRMAGRQLAQELLLEFTCPFLLVVIPPAARIEMPLALDVGVLQRIGPSP